MASASLSLGQRGFLLCQWVHGRLRLLGGFLKAPILGAAQMSAQEGAKELEEVEENRLVAPLPLTEVRGGGSSLGKSVFFWFRAKSKGYTGCRCPQGQVQSKSERTIFSH